MTDTTGHGERHQLSPSVRCGIVAVVLLAAFGLRFVALDRLPTPIHQDELSDIYDGYSIATTGADRTGAPWPLLARSMGPGGYIPTLNMYVCAIAAYFAGFSVWAGRLPAALGGMMTLWLIYLLARRLLGDAGGIWALALAAFSPIHILYSRQVHPGVYLPPLFAMAVLVLLVRWLHRTALDPVRQASQADASASRRRVSLVLLVLLGLTIGFSTTSYSGMRIVAVLLSGLALVAVVWRLGVVAGRWRAAAGAGATLMAAVVIGAAPTIYTAVAMPEAFFGRAMHIMPPLANGPRWWIEWLASNVAANLDPRYLFLAFGDYHQLSVERLGVMSLPFLYLGLVGLVVRAMRDRKITSWLVPAGVIIGLAPGALSSGNPNPMRTSIVWSLYPIAAAYGIMLTWQLVHSLRCRWFSSLRRQRQGGGLAVGTFGTFAMTVVIALSGAWYAARYVDRPDLYALASQRQYVAVGHWLHDHGKDYDRVYIDAEGVFGYLYVAAFSGMTPAEFQRSPREGHVTAMGWDYIDRLGRYRFESSADALAEWRNSDHTESWLVVHSPDDVTKLSPRTAAAR